MEYLYSKPYPYNQDGDDLTDDEVGDEEDFGDGDEDDEFLEEEEGEGV